MSFILKEDGSYILLETGDKIIIEPLSGTSPTVTTSSPIASITKNTAYATGNVTSIGDSSITDQGFAVSTSANPTTADTTFQASSFGLGEYSVQLTSLLPNTTYHVRAYATNSTGTSYGADVSFTTRIGVFKKYYLYKIYDATSGVYLTTWSNEVLSEPRFRNVINGGPGEISITLSRKFDDFGEDVDVKLNNTVECYVVDREAPNGSLIFKGYISGYKPVVRGPEESITISVWSFVNEFNRMILRNASGDTTLTYNSTDPANILKDVIDKYRSFGGHINYTANSVTLTNTTVSYTFNTNTLREVLDKIVELCPVGWYYTVDSSGIIYLRPVNILADHTFTLGLDVENLETYRRIEDLVNRVLFTGGGSPPLFRVYQNTGSQDSYGIYEKKIVDQRVTVTATAQTISNRIISNRKDPEIRSRFTIVDSNGPGSFGYDIESITPGETLKVRNLKTGVKTATYWDQGTWDTDVWDQTIATSAADVIQILSVEYTPDSIVIEASSRLPEIAKRIEDLNRNLENTQTVNNPSAPS